MPDTERFVPILEEIQELFLKHGYSDWVAISADLIEGAREGSASFVKTITSAAVWGSAGSLFDLQFTGNVEGPKADLMRDDKKKELLMLRFAEEMRAQGIRYERAEALAEAIRDWASRSE